MGSINPATMRALAPGKWIWDRGVGVYKAKDGTLSWYVRYYAELPDGTRFQVEERAKDAANRTQADSVRTARRAEVFRGTWRPQERQRVVTFAEFAEVDFLEAKRAQKLRSVGRYKIAIDSHLVPHFGRTITLGGITGAEVKAYYEKRLTECAIATANYELNTIKSIYTEAIAAGLALANPAVGIRMVDPQNERIRRISKDEVRRLHKAANELPWKLGRMLFLTLYWTGMRIDEAQRMTRAQVDLEHRVMRVGTKAGSREVPLLPELEPELRAWLASGAGEVYVFPAERGDGAISNTPVRKWWAALLAKTAVDDPPTPPIDDLTPHDLRHHFAKVLIDRGVEPRIVMAILGWTSWQMLQRYILPDHNEVREAVARATNKYV